MYVHAGRAYSHVGRAVQKEKLKTHPSQIVTTFFAS
jgi:hypothetical protein